VSSYRELLQSTEQYGLAASEQNIASWIRRYVEPTIHDWHSVENTALRVLLDLATLSASELFRPDGVSDIAANVLARALGNSHREAEYPTSYFASLAALTFAASGNFPSASVLASAAKASPDLGPAESWMMQVLANRKIELSRRDVPWGFVSYAQLTDHALATGLKEDFEQATQAFVIEAYSCCGSRYMLAWKSSPLQGSFGKSTSLTKLILMCCSNHLLYFTLLRLKHSSTTH
jgi:hypothetical protein